MSLLRFISWNVNGIRSIIKKDFVSNVNNLSPDLLCLQETKASAEEVKSLLTLLPDYNVYVNSSKARKGYSGTAILAKFPPLAVTFDMNIEEHDQEGRVITTEFDNFFLVTVYSPNAGDGLKRLSYREKWDLDFREYIKSLNTFKPVIIGGDLNVAHEEIDISRARENYNKSPGYTQLEIEGFSRLLQEGFVDTFRHFHPTEVKYTYWNQLYNARARNRGWRIDYFLVSNKLLSHVNNASICTEIFGSDHCHIGLDIDI